nr:EOG090X0ALT [Cyclestheria hislopi]
MDENPWDILNGLPSPTTDVHEKETPKTNDELKIAWRYEGLTLDSNKEAGGKIYDLSSLYKLSVEEKEKVSVWDGINATVDTNLDDLPWRKGVKDWCRNLIQSVSDTCVKLTSTDNPNFVRMVISSYGSPLWQFKDDSLTDFTTTLMLIKSIVRATNSAAMVTIPHHLLNQVVIQRYHDIADFVFHLKTFHGEKELRNVMDIHGVLELKKAVNLVSLKPFLGQSGLTTYGFKATKRKFKIEKLHLPPAVEESKTDNRDMDNIGCSSGRKSEMDF